MITYKQVFSAFWFTRGMHLFFGWLLIYLHLHPTAYKLGQRVYQAGPSGIVVEMIKAAGNTGATMTRNLATAIICNDKVLADWEQSFIVCLYRGKGDALDRVNYQGLKLTKQAMKIQERIVDGLIRQVVSIDVSRYSFISGRGATDTIFVVRQLQEKYLAVNKRIYMAFLGPRECIWQCLSEGYLVGPEKARCWGMDCAVSPGNVHQCTKPSLCWRGLQPRVEWRWGPPGLST